MIGEFGEIVNGIENSVDGLRDVIMHVVQFHFLGLDLLRGDFAVGIE